jgi:ribosome biogenesis protein BRX1
MLFIFLNFLMQISVPHIESDKVARGGLENMTLVEVGGDLLLNLCALSGTSDSNLTL